MSFENLKLNKQLLTSITEAGFTEAKEIQSKTLSRINGGQDIVAIGPEGIGKTTTLVLGVLMRLKYAQEVPRALILVPNKEKGLELVEQFNILGKNLDLKIMDLYPGISLESQKEALMEGIDVVIGTPDRIHAIYLKSGLNLNKLMMFVLDDTEMIIQQGFQTLVNQIADRLPKCQHIIFSEVYHTKLEILGSRFLKLPALIQVDELPEDKIDTIYQEVYPVPNFKSKLNLLKFLLQDREEFEKVVVLITTELTVETIYKSLRSLFKDEELAILTSKLFEGYKFDSVDQFVSTAESRILLVSTDLNPALTLTTAPTILYFETPVVNELYLHNIKNDEDSERGAIIFATDIELSLVSKIEQTTGQKLEVVPIPEGIVVDVDRSKDLYGDEVKVRKTEVTESERGSAFHQKKDKNAKDYNWKFKDRLKMFGKKNRSHKRGEK